MVLLVVCGLRLAEASTYYVNPTGSDENDGQSEESAWRTVAKVNAAGFAPGDQILFVRGGEWREELRPGVSGAPENPITFDAYGVGPKPKFWGSDILINANFTPIGNNTYTYRLNTPVNSVLSDHHFLYTSRVPSWHWSEGVLTINTGGPDPRTDGRLYTACVRDFFPTQADGGIVSYYKTYLTFRNLTTDETAKKNAGYGIRVEGGHDIVVEDCEMYRAGKHHLGAINTGFVGRRLYAAYVQPDLGGDFSAFVSDGESGTPENNTSEWYDCVFDHTHSDETAEPQIAYDYVAFLSHGATQGRILIKNMRALNAIVSLINVVRFTDGKIERGGPIRMSGGLVQNAKLGVAGANILVDGVRVTGPHGRIDIHSDSTDSIVQNALIEGTNPKAQFDPDQTGSRMTAIINRGTRTIIRFNTVMLSPDALPGASCLAIGAHYPIADNIVSSTQIYGNIFISPKRIFTLMEGVAKTGYIADARYNFYSRAATFRQVYNPNDPFAVDTSDDTNFAKWQAQGFDAGSMADDPRFNPDYSLQRGSPAIDAARLNPVLTAEVPTDHAGNQRLSGIAFDMGAFEAIAPEPGTNLDDSFSGAPYITSMKPSAKLRNDTTGYIGMQITTGNFPIIVTSLGRFYIAGNSRSHQIKIVNVSDGSDVPNALVNISMIGSASGDFIYIPLTQPVTLRANTSYYIVSSEMKDGDQWYDGDTAVTTTSAANCDQAIYYVKGWGGGMYPNYTFGPVNFKYLLN